jgi:hypothetical protein
MEQQRRCLTGMTNGLPLAVPVTPTDVTIHTFGSDPTSGLAPLDTVEMHLNNSDATNPARVNVIFQLASGGTLALLVVVAPLTSVKVFDEDPFGGAQSGTGAARIVLSLVGGLSTAVTAWGWFVRTRG